MKATKIIKTFSLCTMLFAVLTSCGSLEDSYNNGLTKKSAVHSVDTYAKLKELLQASYTGYYGYYTDGATSAAETAATDNSATSRDFTGTNEQVEGVSEGDIVKTDGYQIYYAPRYENVIRVFDVDDNLDVSLGDTVELDELYTDSMYLTDKYLIVIGYTYERFSTSVSGMEDEAKEEYLSCCWWYPTGTINVISRETLKSVYQIKTDAYIMDHRLIGDSLYFVAHKYSYYTENEVDYRPSFIESKDGEDVSSTLSYSDIYYFDDSPAFGMNVLIGVKLNDDPNAISFNASAYLGASPDYKKLYVNTTSLYFCETIFHYEENSYYYNMEVTKFNLDNDLSTFEYVSSVILNGSALNQFSIDEYNNYLRVATTDRIVSWTETENNGVYYYSSSSVVTNHLYVLSSNEDSHTFTLVGHLSTGLGHENESIKAVRFNQNTAYVVTFLQTDPLYIIDLSNPEDPLITGSIEQDGFDTYEHPWNKNYLLGIGYSATSNGTINGIKISAYDVSEDENVIQTYALDTAYGSDEFNNWGYSYSEALYNHKAILVSISKGIFAFPVEAYEYNRATNEYSYHSYYYIFKIDFMSNTPISDPIIIEHPVSKYYYVGVDRGVLIEDNIYTISNDAVMVYSLLENQTLTPTLEF